ncbi:SPOR domain-containing protein [Methylocaldum sp. MU1018]
MDQQLKQRLIGATIIASLVVIFVPMLFEDQSGDQGAGGAGDIPALPKEVEERSIELPKSAADVAPSAGDESPDTGYRIIPLTDVDSRTAESEQPPATDSGADSAANGELAIADEDGGEGIGYEQIPPAPKSADSERADVAAKSKQASVKKSKPEPVPPTDRPGTADTAPPETRAGTEKPVSPPKAKTKAVPARSAETAAKKSEAAKAAEPSSSGKSASSSPAAAQKPAPTKPAPSESATKTAEASARPATGGGAKLPEPSASASAESDDLAAWVVQTGSFTAEGNARSLADKLRKSNFPAFVEVVTNAGTSVYRVQVGPELNRARAEQVQKQIENAVGIKGIVIPHP